MNTDRAPKKHSYKNQIRDVKRLLRKAQNNDEMKNQLQKKLYDLEIASYITTSKEDIMKQRKINKKLRFNERMKILRTLKKEKDEKEKTEEEVHLEYPIESMLKYTEYYPDCEKYISLFPHKPLTVEQKQLQKTIMEYTDTAKEDLERNQAEHLENDLKYRKTILPKMLTILKELREKAELANIHSEEEDDSDEDNQEQKEEELDDDFFMSE